MIPDQVFDFYGKMLRKFWMKFWMKNEVFMNIHEYANELICIFSQSYKGRSVNFNLIPILQI